MTLQERIEAAEGKPSRADFWWRAAPYLVFLSSIATNDLYRDYKGEELAYVTHFQFATFLCLFGLVRWTTQWLRMHIEEQPNEG